MRLYEFIERNPRQHRQYVTSQGAALKLFGSSVKKLKKLDVPLGKLSCTVNQVEVDTNLRALDWCDLLTSDAPGDAGDVVIGDFITSRKELKTQSF